MTRIIRYDEKQKRNVETNTRIEIVFKGKVIEWINLIQVTAWSPYCTLKFKDDDKHYMTSVNDFDFFIKDYGEY